jgi:PIN domain nuclease of toxin-antitoxin system
LDILLDTHAFIWYLEGDKQLSKVAQRAIESYENNIFISIASLWEMSIKLRIDKLKLSINFIELNDYITRYKIIILPITFNDIVTNLNLEFHHRDPFDRIIISQAISNNYPIITNDEIFKKYVNELIW